MRLVAVDGLLRFARNDAFRRCVIVTAAGLVLSLAALSAVAVSRAKLVAPKPTLIVYDRRDAFITQVSFAKDEKDRADFGYWPLDRAPDSHVNVRDAVSWHTVRDGLPCFDGFD